MHLLNIRVKRSGGRDEGYDIGVEKCGLREMFGWRDEGHRRYEGER